MHFVVISGTNCALIWTISRDRSRGADTATHRYSSMFVAVELTNRDSSMSAAVELTNRDSSVAAAAELTNRCSSVSAAVELARADPRNFFFETVSSLN